MRRALLVLFLVFGIQQVFSWGFFAHREINRLAIYTLPTELMRFYKLHTAYLSEHAVDADKRRHSTESEAERHYLDADHYESALPFDTIPRRWQEAVNCYPEDTLRKYGVAPWHLNLMLYKLTVAFREKNRNKILKLSADMGHYCGDIHVPLHTTLNYNGQLTGQKGIHGFWESRLPELFADEYDFIVGPAEYLNQPLDAIWDAFSASHAAKDSVLSLEAHLDSTFSSNKYAYEVRGNASTQVYSRAYSAAYHEDLNGMVERRMRSAVKLLGSLWYTAWVNAGSPDLNFVEIPADSMVQFHSEEDTVIDHQNRNGTGGLDPPK